MEQLFTPRKSVWRQKVPQAISNSALVAMVTLCYFGLVSPTLELVQTAQLVQANTMMRTQFDIPLSNNKTQIDAMRNHANSKVDATIIATFPVETPKAIVPVVLLQSNNQGDQNKLSYATLQPNSQNLPASGPFADPVTAGKDTVVLPDLYDVISTKPAADYSANPGNPLSSESANSMEPIIESPVITEQNFATEIPDSIKRIEQLQEQLDEYTNLLRDAYSLLNDPSLTSEQKDTVERNISELKSEITDTMYEQFGDMMPNDQNVPTGHFISTPSVNNGNGSFEKATNGNNGLNNGLTNGNRPNPSNLTTGNNGNGGNSTSSSSPNGGSQQNSSLKKAAALEVDLEL